MVVVMGSCGCCGLLVVGVVVVSSSGVVVTVEVGKGDGWL